MITLTLLMVIIAKFKAEQCAKNWSYQIVRNGGSPLPPEEVISSHVVEPTVQTNCNLLCYKETKCVGFNFRTKINAENCQLTHTTKRAIAGEGEWNLFLDVDAARNENQGMERLKDQSCAGLYKSGVRQDGLYTIDPDGAGSFQVSCDMHTDGGGWTVFQRRQDESVDFYRGWQGYKNGFGDPNGNFWLGLDKIHRLTKADQNVLRVDLMDFNNTEVYAKYSNFAVASESDSYKLKIDRFSGNAGDSMTYHNGMKFTTKDRDNDPRYNNCAQLYTSAWWFNNCHQSNLNGRYIKAGSVSAEGLGWYRWKNNRESMKKTEMKMRPVLF